MSSFSADTLARISELNRQLADAAPAPRVDGARGAAAPMRQAEAVGDVRRGPGESPTTSASIGDNSIGDKLSADNDSAAGRNGTGDTRALPDGVEVETGSGLCWRIQTPLEQLWRGARRLVQRDGQHLRDVIRTQDRPHPELKALADSFPERAMFLDLETCGFAGATVFLVGLLHFEAGRLQLTQLLARNYAEEKAMFHAMWSTAAQSDVLVTFNGKSFDWPCVHDRSTLHRLGRRVEPGSPPLELDEVSLLAPWTSRQFRPELTHCDLLHHARRKWKGQLPNCKLQTLERHLFGRRRRDDIPGSEIPAAYHQFVRTGDAWEMRSVLHHNALDLITLLQLALRIAE